MSDDNTVVYNFDEDVTPANVREATSGGSYPLGKFRCRVVDVNVVALDNAKPPCYAQSFDLEIIETIKHDGKPATDENRHAFDGATMKDDIMMAAHPEAKPIQKPWIKKRRDAAAVALKHIPPTGGKMTNEKWQASIGRIVEIETAPVDKLNEETGKYEPTDLVRVHRFRGWYPTATPEPEIDLDAI